MLVCWFSRGNKQFCFSSLFRFRASFWHFIIVPKTKNAFHALVSDARKKVRGVGIIPGKFGTTLLLFIFSIRTLLRPLMPRTNRRTDRQTDRLTDRHLLFFQGVFFQCKDPTAYVGLIWGKYVYTAFLLYRCLKTALPGTLPNPSITHPSPITPPTCCTWQGAVHLILMQLFALIPSNCLSSSVSDPLSVLCIIPSCSFLIGS